MKKISFLLLLFLQFSIAQNTITNYYFIRHSEKVDNSENPNLSEAGIKRAEKWASIFLDIKLDAIYATNFLRTIQTLTPISEAKNLKIIIYDAKKLDLKAFKKNTLNKSILIVGHSNSTPDFVNKLIGQNKYEKIAETTFGNLYMVTVFKKNNVSSQLLKLEN